MKEKKLSVSKAAATSAKKISKLKAVKAVSAPKAETKKPARAVKAKSKSVEKTLAAKVESTGKKIEAFAEKLQSLTKKLTPKAKTLAEKAEPVIKKVRSVVKKKILSIPPILLEGDVSAPPGPSGPGQRYSLGPTPPAEDFSSEELGELPDAYGTQKLLLTARDPHWLYAHWDFTNEQLKKQNAASRDGHLILRIYKNNISRKPFSETHVHPESRNWFVHVGEGGTKFVAELGYYQRDEKWTSLSVSGATLTPPDSVSEEISVRFATIPVDVPFEELLELVKTAIRENVPLAEAILQLRAEGCKNLPAQIHLSPERWTPAQEKALAQIITMDSVRRVWIGSLEITELLRRQLAGAISSAAAAQFSLPSSFSLSSLSSPFGGMERRKSFWFNVNAELIIYGATEPDAKVTIGGRHIKLRSDGTFSFRFILPDGNYDLPAVATSVDGDDSRSAKLKFSRSTDYRGDVGAHPQDPRMKTPEVANVA